MDRQTAIRRAKDRLTGSIKLSGLLSKFGSVRVFPPLDLDLIPYPQDNEPTDRDFVTFTVERSPVSGHRLMAEYQGIKEFAS